MKIIFILLLSSVSFVSQIFTQNIKEVIFADDFDDYVVGESLVEQNPDDWIIGTTSGPLSPNVTDYISSSGLNSLLFDGLSNLVKPIDNYTEGVYSLKFLIYIPNYRSAYFSIFQHFDNWDIRHGMATYFNSDGLGYCSGGGAEPVPFEFEFKSWLSNETVVDLDHDWVQYFLDGNKIHECQWSTGFLTNNGINQLGGSDFTTAYSDKNKLISQFYVDNYSISKLENTNCNYPPLNLSHSFNNDELNLSWDSAHCPDISAYNIYKDGEYLAFSEDTSYSFQIDPGTYEFCIKALYETVESDCLTATITLSDINEINSNTFKVYPNPFSDHIQIKNEYQINKIEIYNLSGQLLLEKDIQRIQQININTSFLDKGAYILKVNSKNQQFYKQLIICN